MLPLQLVQNWDVSAALTLYIEYTDLMQIFHAILRTRFQQFPGERRVRKGNYEIRSGAGGGRRLTKVIWATSILPGMCLMMNMIVKREIDHDQAYRCPRSDCGELNITPATAAGINW